MAVSPRRPNVRRAGPTRIVLRAPTAADADAVVAAARRSRALHGRWVAAPATRRAFLEDLERKRASGDASFLVCLRDGGAIVGVVNVTGILRGRLQSAYLGYYAFAGHERRGLMREGLAAVVRHAFGAMKLHRLEANIQPGNAASIALAKASGFSQEGYSPRYLKIGGRWRDHERWAIVKR